MKDILPNEIHGYGVISKPPKPDSNLKKILNEYTGFCLKHKKTDKEYEIYMSISINKDKNLYYISEKDNSKIMGLPILDDIMLYKTIYSDKNSQDILSKYYKDTKELKNYIFTKTCYKSLITGYIYYIFIYEKKLYYMIDRNPDKVSKGKKVIWISNGDINSTLIRKNFKITSKYIEKDSSDTQNFFGSSKTELRDDKNDNIRNTLKKDYKILENSSFYDTSFQGDTNKEHVDINGKSWYRYFHKTTNRYYYINNENWNIRWSVDNYNTSFLKHKLYVENKVIYSDFIFDDFEYIFTGYYYIRITDDQKYIKFLEYLDEDGIPCYLFNNGKDAMIKYNIGKDLDSEKIKNFYSNSKEPYILEKLPEEKNIVTTYKLWYIETCIENPMKKSSEISRKLKKKSHSKSIFKRKINFDKYKLK